MDEKKMESRAEAYDIRLGKHTAKRISRVAKAEYKAKMLSQRLSVKSEAAAIKRQNRLQRLAGTAKSRGLLNTASHVFMAGIMLMYFIGVGLGVYVTIWRDEPVVTTMDYIMRLALVVGLGYFVKAFGENVAKIVFPFVFGSRKSEDTGADNEESGNG